MLSVQQLAYSKNWGYITFHIPSALSVQKSLEYLFQSVSVLGKIFIYLSTSRGGVNFHLHHPN